MVSIVMPLVLDRSQRPFLLRDFRTGARLRTIRKNTLSISLAAKFVRTATGVGGWEVVSAKL
jgi:hypothetical protein